MRHKQYDRVPRNFQIDREIDDWLRTKYPGLGSSVINELLRNKRSKEEKDGESLIGFESNAGRLAYTQAMEKLGFSPKVVWKSLEPDSQLEFIKIYKARLADLQARGI